MGVSFKISVKGKRFRSKPCITRSRSTAVDDDEFKDESRVLSKNESSLARKLDSEETERSGDVNGVTGSSLHHLIPENGVSFTLNLFRDGYSIGKPSEIVPTLQDNSKLLLPYDRKSENLFSAIECGRLPGDILDDIPCKYVDGTIVCEVRDFRGCPPEQGPGAGSTANVNKIHLRMSLENVVKDIPLISDNSWTYGDLMEVESRILKALRPKLNLNPAPKFDRLCSIPVPMKLNVSHYAERRKRSRQLSEVSVSSNSRFEKKICIDRVSESFNTRLGDSGAVSGNLSLNEMLSSRPKSFTTLDASLPAQPAVSISQSRYSVGSGTPRGMLDQVAGSVLNPSGVSPTGQEMISYADNLNANVSLHGKRETQDGQTSPLSRFNKRPRPSLMGVVGIQSHPFSSMDGPHGTDMNWKNMLQQQEIARGMQYSNPGVQKFSQQMLEGVLNQDSVQIPFATGQSAIRYVAKEEQFESEKMDGPDLGRSKTDMQMTETENHLDPQHPQVQQRPPQQAFVRSNLSQPPWNSFGQHVEKVARKEDQVSKRKSVQSPRVSAGAMTQPSMSKSGEISSGSGGPQYGVPANISAQKDKPGIIAHIGGTPSLTSSANDSMQRQHQAQLAAKQRSKSLPKTPVMSGVGSPASVGNISVPLNANSPSVGTPPFAGLTMIERFSKIEMVTARHQLNLKKSKVNNYPIQKTSTFPAHNLATHLANSSINDDLKDDACARKMSKSRTGGSLNACKRRVLTFMLQDRIPQGMVPYATRLRCRVILSEKPNDGTVAITYEDIDDSIFFDVEDLLPTLPNTLSADLLAEQLSSLMVHEGYDLIEDNIQVRPTRMNPSHSSHSNAAGHPHINPEAEMQSYGEAFPGQTSNEVPKPSSNSNASLLNASHSLLGNTRMLPPGNAHAMQMSQGILAGVSLPVRPQQMEAAQPSMQQQLQQSPQASQQQNQQNLIQTQQHQQFQRSMMLGTSQLSHLNAIGANSNVQLGTNMANKSSIPLHLLQQQQQQQMQRKMIMGAVGMGGMNNNMVGLGSLGSSMGVGATRGIGGTGLQAPMGSIPAMGNAGQNPMNLNQASNFNNTLSQQFRAGTLTAAQAQQAAYKFRMAQNRGMLGAASQSTITGIPGARQMHPSSAGLSMLGQALNRASLTPMQRAVVPMGPPKLTPGINPYVNQQPQQMQQQQQPQQQQQQLQQPQQQQLQQQPETTPPLQAVVSPQQVGSPSTVVVQQQQQQQQQSASPQQTNQRTPMSPQQMSSGAVHALSAGNQEVCPASPQLSSQTLGSVSSIANSPMDMQGANKSNSVNNP
ncbi:hypothetical protein SDJN02_24140 [Cucurbita argyrosperma subsp. argyrosperma]|nr:hypothetical protein SDJN02_24140 [Cucurbita argyrosperma subsp. argyrosperma]